MKYTPLLAVALLSGCATWFPAAVHELDDGSYKITATGNSFASIDKMKKKVEKKAKSLCEDNNVIYKQKASPKSHKDKDYVNGGYTRYTTVSAIVSCSQIREGSKDVSRGAMPGGMSKAISLCETDENKEIQVGDIVEKYREFTFDGWVNGVKDGRNGVLWLVKEIGDSGLVVEAVEVSKENSELPYSKGQISWFSNSNLYKSKYTTAPNYQQAIESVHACKDVPNFYSDASSNLLVGKWGMRPLKKVKVGAANVTEFKSDGTYKITNFRCTGRNEYSRDPSLDSEGTWKLDGLNIITTITKPEEIETIKSLLGSAFAPRLLESKEKISSLSKKSLMTSSDIFYSYKKIAVVEPDCKLYGLF